MNTPVEDILLSGFFLTLIILTTTVVSVVLYMKFKKGVDFTQFAFFYVFALIGGTSITIPMGIITILNSICFMKEGHPLQNMPIEVLSNYMLYTIFSVIFLNLLGVAGVFATVKHYSEKSRKKTTVTST